MRPAYRVQVGGKERTEEWGERLVYLTVTDEAGIRADSIEVEFDAREEAGGGIAAPPIGTEIQVWLGYEPQPHYMGRYTVDEWCMSGPRRTLRVTARSAELTTAIRAAKTRSWDQKTLGEIVRKIGSEHGLAVQIADRLAALPIAHIDQQNESDVGFLSRLARRTGATFKLADGKVIFAEKGARTLPSGRAKPTTTLRPAECSEWSATTQARGDYRAVRCCYMDHPRGKRIYVTEGSGEPVHRDRQLYASEIEARQAAKAILGELRRGTVAMNIECPGNPEIFAEGLVRLADFDPAIDGDFVATNATHTLTTGGYTTSISLESLGTDT